MHNTKTFVLAALTTIQKENKNMRNIIKLGLAALVTLFALTFVQDIVLAIQYEEANEAYTKAHEVMIEKAIQKQADKVVAEAVSYANYVSECQDRDSHFYNFDIKHTHRPIKAGKELRAQIVRQLHAAHFLHGTKAFAIQGAEWIGNTDDALLHDAMIPDNWI